MAHGLFKDFLPTINSLPIIALVLVAAILTDSLTLAQVNVEPNKALLNEGDRTELLCRYGRRINYCRIEIPGEKVLNLSPEWNKPGFTYFGAGLDAGQCGVSIERIKAVNNGQVKCSLGVEGEELSGTIDLVVAMRPQQPIIELITKPDREGYFNEGSRFQARCTVRGGRPAANITWYIDEMPAYNKRVGRLEIEDMPNERNMTLTTIKQEIEWQVTHEDNGRKLICRSFHQTDRDSLPPQEGAFQLFVHFSPVPQPETLVYGLYLDHTAMVNITINAHPMPVVEWTVDGNVIPQGTSNGRFSAYEPQYLGEDNYNVTLAIGGLTLEDTTKTYLLKASNAFGSTEYSVRISSSSTPPSSGMEIGAIVGIVVAVAVLVLIVLLIIFARATGRWCFGGKSLKTQINETTEKDPRNHGQQVALLETPNGVTIIGNKHTNSANADGSPNKNANNIYAQDRLSVLRRSNPNVDEDDSFEYATDRESSVYNPTTVPIRSVMAAAGGRNSQKSTSDSEPTAEPAGADLLTRGNQLGIPESRFSRWLPKDQREILEKQAKLLANRVQAKTPELERAQRVTEKPTVEATKTEKPTEVATKTTISTQRSQLQETEI